MHRRQAWTRQAFTLVELLIVVAIIGVLSTIGVPTYRRMVQKSKKAEAKTYLGALYKGQIGFQSEFGSFGTNLKAFGVTDDTTDAPSIYFVGFPMNACFGGHSAQPTIPPERVAQITQAYPDYYGTFKYLWIPDGTTTGGRECRDSSISTDGSTFTATATGAIAPNVSHAMDLEKLDQWEINEKRELGNVNDGVQ